MLRYIVIPFLFLSYFFIDIPLVHFVQNYRINSFLVLKILTHIPDVIIGFLVLFFMFFVLFFKRFEKVKIVNVLFLSMAAVAISVHIKDLLKFVFGRYWPDTWIDGNPSLLVHNAYGFHFFQKGSAYQSFPSGHTTVTFAFFTVLIYFYPKYKNACLIPCILLATAQTFMHYHFLSDVIAGAFLGWSIAVIICRFFANKIEQTKY